MVEDYRACVTVDREADGADRSAGRRITCPILAARSTRDDMEELYGDVVAVWRCSPTRVCSCNFERAV